MRQGKVGGGGMEEGKLGMVIETKIWRKDLMGGKEGGREN